MRARESMEKLQAAVRALAEDVLGKEAVDAMLDAAVEATVEQLKEALVKAGTAPMYAELATAMGMNAGAFIMEHGAEALQSDLEAVMSAGSSGDVNAMQSKLVAVCHKVLGAKQFSKVMSVVMGAMMEAAVQQLTDAGLTEKYAAVLVAVGQRVVLGGDTTSPAHIVAA